ncbi:MAG: hypothetical protein J7J76_00070 [Candidatus Latescibacteria bacterium]|nr:hypothetical protein [Candidatus Latescibacterota bacterium]
MQDSAIERREFLKRGAAAVALLPYVAPAITTFLLDVGEAEAQTAGARAARLQAERVRALSPRARRLAARLQAERARAAAVRAREAAAARAREAALARERAAALARERAAALARARAAALKEMPPHVPE